MPLFFVIAGFCYSCRDYKSYVRKKFLHLAVPYIAFNLIDMLPRQLLASLVNRPKPMTESLMKAILRGGEYWFIYTLFIILMVYPLIFRLTAKNKPLMFGAGALFLAVSLHGIPEDIFLIDRVGYYLFFFHAGVMARIFSEGQWPEVKAPVFVMPVMFALWLVLLWGVNGGRVFTALAGIITCYLMTGYKLFNDTFSRFGAYSLQLYLLNGITLGISRAIICNILHVNNPAVIVLFNMLVDFFASYMLIKYVLAKIKPAHFLMGMK